MTHRHALRVVLALPADDLLDLHFQQLAQHAHPGLVGVFEGQQLAFGGGAPAVLAELTG